jgi:hypothetical protein
LFRPVLNCFILCICAAVATWPEPVPASLIASQPVKCQPGEYVIGLAGRTGSVISVKEII